MHKQQNTLSRNYIQNVLLAAKWLPGFRSGENHGAIQITAGQPQAVPLQPYACPSAAWALTKPKLNALSDGWVGGKWISCQLYSPSTWSSLQPAQRQAEIRYNQRKTPTAQWPRCVPCWHQRLNGSCEQACCGCVATHTQCLQAGSPLQPLAPTTAAFHNYLLCLHRKTMKCIISKYSRKKNNMHGYCST